MYFRFPALMVMVFILLIGVLYLQGKMNSHAMNAGEPVVNSDILNPSVNHALETINAAQLRAHLEFLADDLLEGRDTGSRGARVASLYIASQFERVGLKAVGDGQSFFQAVPMLRKQYSPKSILKVEVNGELVSFNYGEDFLVASAPADNGRIFNAELVFTGFGIQAQEYGYDDFKNLDVKGKFTVYFSGEPASDNESFFDGDRPTRHSDGFLKRRIAQNLKAAGAITILQRETLQHVNWADLQNYYGGAKMLTESSGASKPATDFPALIIHPDVAERVFAGASKSYEALEAEAATGLLAAFDLKKNVQVQIITDETRIADRNVVGFLEGSDSDLKSEVVVFSAHYDHVGIGVPVAGDSIYNGAGDNASGVSGLLELADAFSALSIPPKRSLLFLAVTAEEKGLLGSEYYVENPIYPMAKTVANFNFDIIGIGDSTGLVVYGQERSSLGTVVEKAAQQFNLKIMPDDLPEENIFIRSDHYSFAKKGVPAIFPSFGLDRAGFQKFIKYYHQPSDDLSLPFNFNYMKKHVQVVFLAGMWVANASKTPTWTKGDEFEKARESTRN